MVQLPLARFEAILSELDLEIVDSIELPGRQAFFVDSKPGSATRLTMSIVIDCIDADGEIDSEAVFWGICDAGTFSDARLYRVWTEFGLPTPSWLRSE